MVNTEFISYIIHHILINMYISYKLLFLREILLPNLFKLLDLFSPQKEGFFFVCLFFSLPIEELWVSRLIFFEQLQSSFSINPN